MVAKRGRPTIENAKDYTLRVRMNNETIKKLDELFSLIMILRIRHLLFYLSLPKTVNYYFVIQIHIGRDVNE